jgi:type IV pilus assembly protein PilA
MNQRGFTLVELLIAIVVAGVLMTIAAFSLVRARANANEASAIAALKAINSGQVVYNSACGRGFYAGSLPVLAMPPHQAAKGGYIDSALGSANVVQHNGYRLRLTAAADAVKGIGEDCNGNPTISSYYATAVPVAVGDTGTRGFATNQVGSLWQDNTGSAPPEPFGPPSQLVQ